MRLNGARNPSGRAEPVGERGGWAAGRVTVLLLQVCHGRDEPPRVPCGELVWSTLQKALLRAPFCFVPSHISGCQGPRETLGLPAILILVPRHGFLPAHPFLPTPLHPFGLFQADPGVQLCCPRTRAPLPPSPLPVLPTRSYNDSCSPDPAEQGGPKTCCTLDDVPLIR